MWTKFIEGIASSMAFFPPEPALYTLDHIERDRYKLLCPLIGDNSQNQDVVFGVNDGWNVRKIKTKKASNGGGTEIVTAMYKLPDSKRQPGPNPTLLYSHGNATDIGGIIRQLQWLAFRLNCDVLCYDYSGYGESTGTPSPSNTYQDIEAVYSMLVDELCIPEREIVIFGQSIGSGPSTWLAARKPDAAALVLQSPLMSGVMTLYPTWTKWPAWADVFPNHKLMPQVRSKVLVMHGTYDDVIDVSHGKELHRLAQDSVRPLWAQGYDHFNIEACPQYLESIQQVIKTVGRRGR